MLTLTLAKVQPLLAKPPSGAQTPRVEGWLAGISVLLNTRYPSAFPTTPEEASVNLEPLFLVYVADAVQRRLDKARQMLDSEGAGPFSARWSAASSLGAWFLPAELEEMDSITGGGGTRTYRTAAPDYIRFNNRLTTYEPETELEYVAGEALGGPDVSSY